MGTQEKKVNAKLRKRLKEIWKVDSVVELSTTECVELLRRIRTYYMHAWMHQLAEGEILYTSFFESMVEKVNGLIVSIETERVQADTEIAKTIVKYPLMLSTREQTDLMHALDAESLSVPDA